MSAVTATLSDKHCVVTIANETHTLPALLRSALCSRQDVAFSGYKVAHPLDREVQLSVIGTGNPAQAVAECCAALTAELRRFREGLE